MQTGDLGKLVDAVVARAAELPHEEFDPAALAKRLGNDPQAHFEWVRDHTWWVPYRGLLRGSEGVLLDRVGSNLDRAVLLADLLRHSGSVVRLAHAELPENRARELVDELPQIPDQRINTPVRQVSSNESERDFQALVPGLEASIHQQFTDSRELAEKAGALVNSQSSELLSTLKESAGQAAGGDRQAAIGAMRDYWWVEREEKGKWIAMDLVSPTATAARTPVTASALVVWKDGDGLPAVPDPDVHSVKFRLVIERYSDGATTESTVLETVMRPAELLELPITLTHMPKPWPETLPAPASDPNAVGNAAVSVKEWLPVLQVGSEQIAQSGFTDSGDLIADPLSAKRDIAATGGGGNMTGFADALGGGVAAASSLTAEWLEFEIHVPGKQVQQIRRPVFDLLGPANRSPTAPDFDASTNERLIARYEALLGSTQILLQTSDLTGSFLAHLDTKSIVANQAAFRELARERDPAKATKLASDIFDRLDVWGPLPILSLWRARLAGPSRVTFIDRPNVLSYRVGMPAVNADRVEYREQIDIAANSTGVHWGTNQSSFDARVRQGVADTVAEILALGGNFRMTDNTASLFSLAAPDQKRGKLVEPRDVGTTRQLAWPDEAIARLAGDVDAGFMAVVLDDPVLLDERRRVGWWRIDPTSGETIGVMDTGFHGGMDERVETELEIAQLRNALRNWMKNNASRIRAARARANVPWEAAEAGDAELLQVADRCRDVLKLAMEAGF